MGELRTAKAELETTLKTHVEETEVSLVALQSDKKMLQMELAHYEQRLGQGCRLRVGRFLLRFFLLSDGEPQGVNARV